MFGVMVMEHGKKRRGRIFRVVAVVQQASVTQASLYGVPGRHPRQVELSALPAGLEKSNAVADL